MICIALFPKIVSYFVNGISLDSERKYIYMYIKFLGLLHREKSLIVYDV